MRLSLRRRREPVVDVDAVTARRIAGAYALSAVSPLARYAESGELIPTQAPLLLEEIEWARAAPWLDPEHLRDLTWLSDYLSERIGG